MAQVNQFQGGAFANPAGLGQMPMQMQNMPGVGNFGFPTIQKKPKEGFLAGLRNFFAGTPESFQQVPTQTLQGMQALQQLLGGGMEGLQDIYAGFNPIEEEARNQFYTETIPSIAERFTAMGNGGAQRSSAFQGALGQAGSGLERQLAALRSQYGLQNRQGLLQQLQLGLTPQFDTKYTARQPGLLEKLPELGLKAAGLYFGANGFPSFGKKAEIEGQ